MYLLDTKIKDNEIMTVGLTMIYGIGLKISSKICKKLGVSRNLRINQLPKNQRVLLSKMLDKDLKLKVSNELRKVQSFRSQRLLTIKCYRGLRKIKGLPVRGQRTHTNAKTARKPFSKLKVC
jgi:small subunit ribosomal protein S13